MSDRAARADPFAPLVLHHLRVNWDDPKWERNSLSNFFMGKQPHWEDSRLPWTRMVKNQFGPAGEKMHPLEIERDILAKAHPRRWGGISRFGKPYYQHMLTLTKLMFPKTDITDTLADAVMFFCTAVSAGKKIVNLIGSQNSSKTAGACRIAFTTMFINPEYTRWTVANPFDNVADSGVWGEIEILWDDLGNAWPGGNHTILFPEGLLYSDRRIEFIPNRPRVARIELRNIKHTGKGKGAKSRKGEDNEDLGIFGEIVDEINEIDNPAFLKRVINSSSQDNYICITGQNFKDPEDMGGQITEPDPAYGGPDSFEKLNVDDDVWWHSVDGGITLRFDGHNAANVLAKRIIYSYLFKEEDRLRIASKGEESPAYYSQVRSFPVMGATLNALLSRPKLSASRHTDTFFAAQGPLTAVSFCDPAFGGRDDAVWGYARFGMFRITDADGRELTRELIFFPEHFITLKLVRHADGKGIFNSFWRQRYQALGLDTSGETEGAEVSFEDQIAIQCLEHNRQRGIPSANFGYDFSMRPDIVSSVNKILGFSAVAFAYNQPPIGVPLVNFRGILKRQDANTKKEEDSKEMCKSRCTELGMLAADMFLSKCLRGGENIPTAITQLCRTHLEQVNRKYKIEDKAEYKARWNNVSPDHRDVLVGICGMATLRGFRAELKTANRDKSGTSNFSALIRSASRFKKRVVAKLPSR